MRAIIVLAMLLVATVAAGAAEIKALITTAMHAAIVELVPPFERASGHKVTVSYDPSGGLAQRLRKGEFADMILVASTELDKLIGEKKVRDRTDVSRTGIGLAVKKGAPHPDVSTPDALKKALLAAKSIGQTSIDRRRHHRASRSARAVHAWHPRTGLAPAQIRGKGGPNGRVSVLVASGEAEIGLQQVSELMSNPDVEVIGLLPDKLQQITINAAGITAAAKEPDAARALIKHLTTPEALAIYKTKGLGL